MVQGICTLLAMTGLLQALGSVVKMERAEWTILYLSVVILTGVMIGISRLRAMEPYTMVIPVAGALILAIDNPSGILRGLAAMLNFLISWWNLRFEDGKLLLPASQVTTWELLSAMLFCVTLVCVPVWGMIRKRCFLQVQILILAVLMPGIMVGRFSAGAFACLLLIGICARSEHVFGKMTRQSGIWLAGMGILLTVCVCLLGNEALPGSEVWKLETAEFMEQLRFGEDTLPEGDLRRASDWQSGTSAELIVTTTQVKDLYLRGYVGARYVDGAWKPLARASFSGVQAGVWNWLQEQEFNSASQYAEYQLAGDDMQWKNPITVENVSADRAYVYLPYSAQIPDRNGIRQIRDGGFCSSRVFGSRKYETVEYSGNLPAELLNLAEWTMDPKTEEQRQFLQTERVYEQFVRGQYSEVDADLEQLLREVFMDDDGVPQGIYEASAKIRSVLEETVSFGNGQQTIPEGEDPIRWFLKKSRKGNASMYASAAVQAFRLYGIPARYAEGYLLKEQQCLDAEEGQIVLTGQDVHAWCEVYMDGLGWIPIDVTPGYYYETYALIKLIGDSEKIMQTLASQESGATADQVLDDEPLELAAPENDKVSEVQSTLGGLRLFAGFLLRILLLAGLFLAGAELIRALVLFHTWRKFRRIGARERAECLCSKILNGLQAAGIDGQPGWQVQETEQAIIRLMPAFSAGEYVRVSQLTMKVIYGNQPLEPWEERILVCFLVKLHQQSRKLGWRIRLRFRYQDVRKGKIVNLKKV